MQARDGLHELSRAEPMYDIVHVWNDLAPRLLPP